MIRVNKNINRFSRSNGRYMRSDLETKKNLIVEETKYLHKFVMPRIKPFNAIC